LTETEKEIEALKNIIRQTITPEDMGMIVSNIGVDPGFSAIYTTNAAMHTRIRLRLSSLFVCQKGSHSVARRRARQSSGSGAERPAGTLARVFGAGTE
jgi:hypothetical protein